MRINFPVSSMPVYNLIMHVNSCDLSVFTYQLLKRESFLSKVSNTKWDII